MIQKKNIFNQIINLIKNKNYEVALNLLDKIKIDEKSKNEVFKLKAFIYIQLGEWKKSIFFNERLIDLREEGNPQIYNMLGAAYFNLGNLNKSIEKFKNSIKYDKKNLLAYDNIGIAYKRLGNFEQSIKYFVKALEINSNAKHINRSLIDIFNFYDTRDLGHIKICELNNKISHLEKKTNLESFNEIINLLKESENVLNKEYQIFYNATQIVKSNNLNLNCERHLNIFNKFNLIPRYCFNCFKVQVQTINIAELIKLYFYFNRLNLKNNNIRKCTIELRNKISGNYKGYIFSNSINDAEQILNLVTKDLINNKIHYKKIEIKHGCTEYYDKFPKYKSIEQNNFSNIYKSSWEKIENEYDIKHLVEEQNRERIISPTLNKFNLSDFLIIKNWAYYSQIIGDDSFAHIFNTNGNSLFIRNILKDQIDFRKQDLN